MSPVPRSPAELTVVAVGGLGEVSAGDDLAELVARGADLRDGDVLVVTSKVVSKAEGRVSSAPKEDLLPAETDRVVARRGRTTVVRTHLGLVLAGAGLDASNTSPGTTLLLPRDPDASARLLRSRLHERTGRNVAVVVSDTAGRAWRAGQTDVAIGVAGLPPLVDHAGVDDAYGNPLVVTAPAIADEVAAAADLVKGKVMGRPVALVRGLAAWVSPAGEHGPGAAALVRPEAEDLFGLGSREAVLTALSTDRAPGAVRGFGAAADPDELVAALTAVTGKPVPAPGAGGEVVVPLPEQPREAGRWEARCLAAAVALGWHGEVDAGGLLRLMPRSP